MWRAARPCAQRLAGQAPAIAADNDDDLGVDCDDCDDGDGGDDDVYDDIDPFNR